MLKVLIVDDNVSIVKVTRILLEREGFSVQSADDEQCFVIAAEWNPSVILMDVRLVDLDGVEATLRLKSNPATGHIPVILVTADSNAAELVEHATADDLLIKPFSNKDLIERIRQHGGVEPEP